MTNWIVIAAVAVGTYALRVSMFVVVGRRAVPAWLSAAMTLVGPAAIAALVGSMLFTSAGGVGSPPAAELIALLAGFGVARRTGNVAHALLVGLPAFWVLDALIG
jgi:branched-subunit amino acid transport protein